MLFCTNVGCFNWRSTSAANRRPAREVGIDPATSPHRSIHISTIRLSKLCTCSVQAVAPTRRYHAVATPCDLPSSRCPRAGQNAAIRPCISISGSHALARGSATCPQHQACRGDREHATRYRCIGLAEPPFQRTFSSPCHLSSIKFLLELRCFLGFSAWPRRLATETLSLRLDQHCTSPLLSTTRDAKGDRAEHARIRSAKDRIVCLGQLNARLLRAAQAAFLYKMVAVVAFVSCRFIHSFYRCSARPSHTKRGTSTSLTTQTIVLIS